MTWQPPALTLGWAVLDWIADNLPSPSEPDKPFIPTDEQCRFVLDWYSLYPHTGRYVYRRAVIEQAKGWGKSPLAAALVLAWRLWRGESAQPAVSGFIGVGVSGLIAFLVGSTKGYFLYGIWMSLAWALVFAVSVLIRRPIVGYAWSALGGHGSDWRGVRRAVWVVSLACVGAALVAPWTGAELRLPFALWFSEPGFKNHGSEHSVVENGTFMNTGFIPHIGYYPKKELTDPNERRKRGLPERERMRPPTDMAARANTFISREGDWIRFASTVSTTGSGAHTCCRNGTTPMPKSGCPHSGNLNEPTRSDHVVPFAAKYSLTYQNEQSSVESTFIDV